MRKAEKRVGRDAEQDIIRPAQQENFQEEYKALAAKKQIPQRSVIVKLEIKRDLPGS